MFCSQSASGLALRVHEQHAPVPEMDGACLFIGFQQFEQLKFVGSHLSVNLCGGSGCLTDGA